MTGHPMLYCSSSVLAQLAATGSRHGVARSLHSSTVRRAAVVQHPLPHQHLARLSSTPAWSNEAMTAVRQKYESKYADRLQQKAREQGLQSVEELKVKAIEEGRMKNRVKDILAGKTRSQPVAKPTAPKAAPSTAASSTKAKATTSPSTKSPIKPLNDIVDLPKLQSESLEAVTKLWNAYHQLKPNTLSAVIPAETYKQMTALGKQYSQFVVPLPRDVKDEQGVDRQGAEMHFLEWAFLPSESNDPSLPGPSTVLFTPLALYQSQMTYAQPHVILTHYPDLLESHGVVLMRGDLTDSVSTKLGDAQLLVLRLQQFYQASHPGRTELLKTFHEKPAEFDIQKLVDIVGEI